jgi:mannose-6-phosphate isomerase-like protein (cupin superfamily)
VSASAAGLVVASPGRPARVHGVHGTSGLTYWRCLTRRAGLAGTWEAIEWASIPPGGISGEHRHTRTEEIYFVLSGRGELLLDGAARDVAPGDLVLTTVGGTHGLRNVGDQPLDWLVVEIRGPSTAAELAGGPSAAADTARSADGDTARSATRNEEATMDSIVVHLPDIGEVDPRAVFASPLESVRILRMAADEGQEIIAEGVEHTLFVLTGEARIHVGGHPERLAPGASLTLPLGTRVLVTAGPDGVECFAATLRVGNGG